MKFVYFDYFFFLFPPDTCWRSLADEYSIWVYADQSISVFYFSLLAFFNIEASWTNFWHMCFKCLKKLTHKRLREIPPTEADKNSQWYKDFDKEPFDSSLHMTEKYVELFIQYCYITMLVVVFPLGPTISLMVNLIIFKLQTHFLTDKAQRQIPKRYVWGCFF